MLIIDTVGPPRIAFKPGSPISIEALSTRSLADTLTRRAVFGPNRMNLCTCATFPTASCQTTKLCPGEKHLYSVDPDVLRSPSLSEYLDLGSTCRTVNGEDIFEDLYEYIESCLGDYLGHVEESTGFDTSLLHDFYNAALASVRDLVDDWQLAESTNAEDPSAKALRDLSALAKLTLNDWDDVIALTICDKHEDKFCVTCKLAYGINAWNYLEAQRDTYVLVRETEPALVARIAATCAAFGDVVWCSKNDNSATKNTTTSAIGTLARPEVPTRTSHLMLSVKFHKNPIAMRPTCANANKPEVPTARRVNSALSLILATVADQMW